MRYERAPRSLGLAYGPALLRGFLPRSQALHVVDRIGATLYGSSPIDTVAMSTNGAKESDHISAIDGLRGIACLAVVIHHCYVHCGKYQWPSVDIAGHTMALSRVLGYGNGGVELFFVLSGFCLASPFFRRSKAEPWRRWFLKRAYRILPPYYGSALLFWGLYTVLHKHPFSLFGMLSPPTGEVSLKGAFVCVTLLNAYFNPSYWTLALEARWYLVFPLLIMLWRRAGSVLLVCGSLFACAASLWLTSWSPRFVLLTAKVLTFLPIFVAGMLIARWTAEATTPRRLIRAAPWGLLASLLFVVATVPSDGSEGAMPMVIPWGLVAFFALISTLTNRRLSRFARTPAFVRIGVFSYSLYLTHEPIVHLAYALFEQHKPTPAVQFLVYECGLVPVCVGIGYVFYRIIERPFVQRGRVLFTRTPLPALTPHSTSHS